MGGGGGGEAAAARADEVARQERIRKGTERINGIFDGGYTYGTDALGADSAFDPNTNYYLEDGSVWTPDPVQDIPFNPISGMFHGLGNVFDRIGADGKVKSSEDYSIGDLFGMGRKTASPEDQFKEMLSGGKLFSGNTTTTGFGDDFFSGRKQSYLDYAMPQLQDQFGDAQKELTYALARGGNLNSSTRADKVSELQKMFSQREQEVRDQALAYENDAKNSVESARSDLIAMLNATGDAQGAVNSALTRSQILTQPQQYNPLGQLFTDFTSGLGTQAALERSYAAGGSSPKYNTGLFGGQGRVTVR